MAEERWSRTLLSANRQGQRGEGTSASALPLPDLGRGEVWETSSLDDDAEVVVFDEIVEVIAEGPDEDVFSELLAVEGGIEPVLFQQFLVGAAFRHPSAIDDEDLIGGQDSTEPVGNRDRGAALHQRLQCRLDQPFRMGIEGRGGLIQD